MVKSGIETSNNTSTITTDEDKPLMLIFPYDVAAHYLRCIKLARYLSNHFRIKFLYSKRYHSFLQSHGYDTFNCRSLDADRVQKEVERFSFNWIDDPETELIYLDQVRAITEEKADAVLSDFSPTLKMAAESTGVTHFALKNGYMTKYYALVRKMPTRHRLYRMLKWLPNFILDPLTSFGEQQYFRHLHRPFAKIRKKYRLSRKASYPDELEGDVNLICDLPQLFPQKDLPTNYRFISPLFYDMSSTSIDLKDLIDRSKKTLFVSMGSTGNWSKAVFLNSDLYKKYNIVTAGDTARVVKGENVLSYAFINMHDVLPYADLAICHGGNGTIYQALSYGLPIVCRTTQFEQAWNVAALERLKLGRSLDGKNEKEIFQIIEEMVSRKDKEALTDIQVKVNNARRQLESMIADIVKSHLPNASQV